MDSNQYMDSNQSIYGLKSTNPVSAGGSDTAKKGGSSESGQKSCKVKTAEKFRNS